ncbi:MAG: DEAD/DEAH box helicase [Ignisphaera sp.]
MAVKKAIYNASYLTLYIAPDGAPQFSQLVGEMERVMTYKMGEMGLVEEDIPVGCARHPNFSITCPACKAVFSERQRVRPFALTFPNEQNPYYTLSVPIGLLPYLLARKFAIPDAARKIFLQVWQIVEEKHKANLSPSGLVSQDTIKMFIESEPHREAVWRALHTPRATIKGIPGAGKTWVAMSIMANLSRGARICWLTHTRALLKQTASRIKQHFNEPIGIVGEGEANFRERITIAMFQTLYSRLRENDVAARNFVKSVDVIICDESHHIPAQTFLAVMQTFTKAYTRYGLTATPFREIKKEDYMFIGGLSPQIIEIDVQPTPIHLVVYDMKGSVAVPEYRGSPAMYQRQYEIAVVRNWYRNLLAAWEAIKHRPAVVLVQRIEHGERLAALIKKLSDILDEDVKVAFMWGKHDADERAQILSSFERGETQILILSDVGKEGLSLKNLNCVVLAAGQKSKVALIQRVGRGLHPKGKHYVRVVDFLDAGGAPRKHSLRRLHTMQQYFVIQKREVKDWRAAVQQIPKAALLSAFTAR